MASEWKHHPEMECPKCHGTGCLMLWEPWPDPRDTKGSFLSHNCYKCNESWRQEAASGTWIVEFQRRHSGDWQRSGNAGVTVKGNLSDTRFDTEEAAEQEAAAQMKKWPDLKYRATEVDSNGEAIAKGETMATESELLMKKLKTMAEASKTPEKSVVTHQAEIVKHDGAIMVPKTMTMLQAAQLLIERNEYENQVISMHRTYDAFWHDGAVALDRILTDKYGWSPMKPTPSFFGPKPPAMINVECSYGVFKSVPWGRFFIPGIEAVLDMGVGDNHGRQVFYINGEKVARKWQPQVDELFDLVAEELRTNSIYKGKAWRLDITGAACNGEPPLPKLVDTDIEPSTLIFSRHVTDAVETNVFTPLRRYIDLKQSGLPFKRGVLLSGTFGTGKTLAAKVASRYAIESGITFIVCCHAADLAACVEYARLYQPAVVFVEDIDREVAGERDASMDNILNVVDGIDSKKADVMIVLTSNNVESINKAMLRPGRLDAVIDVTPPDVEAVERLLRHYGRGVIPATEDVSEAARTLDGAIPAVIAEVVKRARLAALKLTAPGTSKVVVNSAAISEAAATMKMQLDLLYGKPVDTKQPTIEVLIAEASRKGLNSHAETITVVHNNLNEVHGKVNAIVKKVAKL